MKLTFDGICGSRVLTLLCMAGAVAITPVVSLVALPIFAFKAAIAAVQERYFYNQTVDKSGSREKFGRIAGQDYTRWDGQDVAYTIEWAKFRAFEWGKFRDEFGLYNHTLNLSVDSFDGSDGWNYDHGRKNKAFKNEQPYKKPLFETVEDLNWLKNEFKRMQSKDSLDSNLKIMRACAKALIPIAGIYWVFVTESREGYGAFPLKHATLDNGPDPGEWNWSEAIQFHQKKLSTDLALN